MNMEIDLTKDTDEYIVPEYASKKCVKLFSATQAGGEWKDITLVAGNDQQRVFAHRLILTADSPYFEALLLGGMREADEDIVTMANVDGVTLQALIRFCYLGRIDIDIDDVEVLLAAASGMNLVQVEMLCERHCLKKLRRDNCLRLWWMADRYSLTTLKKKAYIMVLDSFSLLVNGDEFKQMERDSLLRFLADDNLSVYCEEDVIKALVGWIRFDEDNRRMHFAELMNSVVRFKEMNMEQLSRAIMPWCTEWSSSDVYVSLMLACQSTANSTSSRFSIQHPIPMIIGTNANMNRDRFTIEKFSHLQKNVVEVINFAGYRNGHSAVQVGHHLYVLGGKDAKGNILDRVQRVNIRNWTVEDVRPMRLERAYFPSVQLDGFIYAMGANFNAVSTELVKSSVERYDIAKDEWENVAAMPENFLRRSHRQINAIAYLGRIAVIYPGGLAFYEPLYNEWFEKAGVPDCDSTSDPHVRNGILKIRLSDFDVTDCTDLYEYSGLKNTWEFKMESSSSCKSVLTVAAQDNEWILKTNFLENGLIKSRYTYYTFPGAIEHIIHEFSGQRRFSIEEKRGWKSKLKLIVPNL